jgi:hypothetical protein
MTLNNLKLMDMDEHLRDRHKNIHKNLLVFCEDHNLTLDLATSDVVIYLCDSSGGSICLG